RIFKTFSKEFPGLADSCLIASKRAWAWAKKNPNLIYDQDLINKNFDPDITTGTYGDNNVKDELFWAAAELYATTKEDVYLTTIKSEMDKNMSLPSWSNVEALGYYSLLRNRKELPEASKKELDKIEYLVLSFSNKLINGVSDNPYATVMGKSEKDFIWGSNAVAANQGIALIQAYLIKSEAKYLNYALANLDYLLGRNATGYSFVTGFGDKSPKHPHHRPSEADEVKEPVPGLLVGGPNSGKQDGCSYPHSLPSESYVDEYCSYASNEIAINWNAPFVYLAGALEVMQGQIKSKRVDKQ
ncbi:MAG TPA: glycoside hydrolase family 9 protein, partial [Cytophagales bacterium]|nr:glycoside hydrolase family 9 protein [Cytophagales bacterium]